MKQLLCLMLSVILLSGCTSMPYSGGLTPMPSNKDLSDTRLKEAVTAYLKSQKAPPYSEYDFVRHDLNDDGARDGIVLFKIPHTYWCGWDGCAMVVFKSAGSKFSPITTVRNVRGPIYISKDKTRGWQDIIIRVSGAKMADKDVVLRNNGSSYPKRPITAPELQEPLSSVRTHSYFR